MAQKAWGDSEVAPHPAQAEVQWHKMPHRAKPKPCGNADHTLPAFCRRETAETRICSGSMGNRRGRLHWRSHRRELTDTSKDT